MNWIRLGWGTFLNKSVMATVDYIVCAESQEIPETVP